MIANGTTTQQTSNEVKANYFKSDIETTFKYSIKYIGSCLNF